MWYDLITTHLTLTLNRFAPDHQFLKPINWPRLAALLQEHLGLEWEYEEQGAKE
jgi:hypothetical protein